MIEYMIRPESFGATIFEKATLRYFFLTHAQFAHITSGSQLDAPGAEQDISEGQFSRLCQRLADGACWELRQTPQPLPRQTLAAPVRVYFEVTRSCNLRCRYCLNRSGRPLPNELTTPEVQQTIRQLGCDGVFEARVTGGEPLVRRDFALIAQAVRHAGMAFSVNSNLVYNLDTIEQLADLRPELLITSLDAAEGPHTAARGPGYCQTVQNIKWLRAAGVPVRLNCTLSRATLPYLESFIDEFAPLGCGFCFILTRPTGRAVSAFNPPPLDDLIAAVSRIEARRLDYPDVYVSTSFAVVMDHEVSIGGINLTGCNAVQKSFNINSDGTISPCAFLFELSPDAYSLGNLREEDYSVLRVWRESQLLGQLRHKSYQANRRCITCSHFKKDCLGTCVFMTCYRERTGQVDPYCRESIATGCHCCRQFGTGASDTLNGSSL